MNIYLEKVRKWGIKLICKTYGPKEIPIRLFAEILQFS